MADDDSLTTERPKRAGAKAFPALSALGAWLLLGSSVLLPRFADAAALDRLKSFVDGTRSGKAAFTQTIAAKSGRKPQTAAGTMMFLRPGKFRWVYEKPYYQLIVGDGERLWVYDRDLDQVSVRKLSAALGSSPAALLAGPMGDISALERNFALAEAGAAEGIEWIEARPRTADAGFESLRLGFFGDSLAIMELRDNLGQTTTLLFSQFERNPPLSASQFRFVPPKGADVIGE
jgi:outer membrane lipoprotein carrier protein